LKLAWLGFQRWLFDNFDKIVIEWEKTNLNMSKAAVRGAFELTGIPALVRLLMGTDRQSSKPTDEEQRLRAEQRNIKAGQQERNEEFRKRLEAEKQSAASVGKTVGDAITEAIEEIRPVPADRGTSESGFGPVMREGGILPAARRMAEEIDRMASISSKTSALIQQAIPQQAPMNIERKQLDELQKSNDHLFSIDNYLRQQKNGLPVT
jgi:hypothetical protein